MKKFKRPCPACRHFEKKCNGVVYNLSARGWCTEIRLKTSGIFPLFEELVCDFFDFKAGTKRVYTKREQYRHHNHKAAGGGAIEFEAR